ncbi:MAG: flagellar hook assembly protein FlgD [Planctomycetota bacterium]|jgi:flagellar basal-body rod modification protein FlgD
MNPIIGTSQASEIQMDYMKLLVTQLQNQNPLEPLDNQEMASQLAQFSQLQQLENMNMSFADVLATSRRNYAESLIGKDVSFTAANASGAVAVQSGKVEEIYFGADGEILLNAGDWTVGLEDLLTVKN